MKKNHRFLKGAAFVAALVAIDQASKAVVSARLKGKGPLVVVPGVFELSYLENRGAAFNILQGQRLLFLVATPVMVAAMLFLYLKRIPAGRRFFAMRLIALLFLSGAIGNYIDRLFRGYVVDFFYFVPINFPKFNMADVYVTAAAAGLLFFGFFYYKEEDFDVVFSSKKDPKGAD